MKQVLIDPAAEARISALEARVAALENVQKPEPAKKKTKSTEKE